MTDLRDYFAAHATDGDIEALKDRVPRVSKIVGDSSWRRMEHGHLPDDWRQIARYMHADAMLKTRAEFTRMARQLEKE